MTTSIPARSLSEAEMTAITADLAAGAAALDAMPADAPLAQTARDLAQGLCDASLRLSTPPEPSKEDIKLISMNLLDASNYLKDMPGASQVQKDLVQQLSAHSNRLDELVSGRSIVR